MNADGGFRFARHLPLTDLKILEGWTLPLSLDHWAVNIQLAAEIHLANRAVPAWASLSVGFRIHSEERRERW